MLSLELEDRAYKALGHRDRRRILRAIGTEERPVGALADEVGLAQPIASQHLRVLRDAGLVQVRADGNRRFYAVEFGVVSELRTFLDQFWSDRLARLQQVAEAQPDPEASEGD